MTGSAPRSILATSNCWSRVRSSTTIKDDLNKGKSRLAELDLDLIKGENARRHAQLERRVKIQQLKTRLELDRAKLIRTSQVVSQVNGKVVQVLVASGELVHGRGRRSFCWIAPRARNRPTATPASTSRSFSCRRARERRSISATRSR